MKRIILLGGPSYILIGLAHVIIASLLPALLSEYDRLYTDGGIIIFLQFAGFLVGVLSAPWMVKILGKRKATVLAMVLLGLAQVGYSLLPSWWLMLLIAMFSGYGFGQVESLIGSLVIQAADKNKAVEMSKLEVCFGIGAMSMPIIAGLLLLTPYWHLSFLFNGIFAFIIAYLWGKVSLGSLDHLMGKPDDANAPASAQPTDSTPLRYGVLALFICLFLIYVGLEMSIANFFPSMLIESYAIDEATAPISVTLFWGAMTIGRLFAGTIAEKIHYFPFMILSSGMTLLLLILMLVTSSLWLDYVIIFLIGIALAGAFAVSIVWANTVMTGRIEQVTSILIASGGAGGALFPLITGRLMDLFPQGNATMWLFTMLAAVFCLLTVSIRRLA